MIKMALIETSIPAHERRLRIGPGGDILVLPPVALFAALGAGGLVEALVHATGAAVPLLPTRAFPFLLRGAIFAVAVFAAIALGVTSHSALAAVNTQPEFTPVNGLAKTGIYRLTRNPIYAAFVTIHLGVAIFANSIPVLIMLLPLLLYLHGTIVKEEELLARLFGTEYDEFKSKVPRWALCC